MSSRDLASVHTSSQRDGVRSLLMLLPGGAGVLALVGLATGRLGDLSDLDASRFLVFTQVELLALGIGRLGYDQLVLSRTSHLADGDDLGFLRIMGRVVAPVTLLVSALLALAIGTRLDVALGIGVMIAAPLDVVSTITGSFELGRRRYAANLVFSWLNYPVFLIGLLVPIPGLDTSRLSHIVGLFCATSVLRSGVATALLVAHHRRQRLRPIDGISRLAGADLADAGLASACQVAAQRADGLVLAVLADRFELGAVSSYLLAARLVDASFTVSAVVASLRQVARGVERVDWRSMGFRGFVVGWSAMWFGGAIALALLNWPDVGTGWGRLVVAALAASAYLAIFRHVLVALASGPEAKIGRRFVAYLGVTSMGAIAAVGFGEPAWMFVPMIINGLWSLKALVGAQPVPVLRNQ